MSKTTTEAPFSTNAILVALNRDLGRLLGEMSDGILVVNADLIVFANAQLAVQLGAESPTQLIGTEALHWIDPADHVAWKSHLAGESSVTALKMVGATGEAVHVELSTARPISLAPEARIMMTHDVTERHRLEQRLLDMALRERRRIAYDLHDGLGQGLTAVMLQLRLVREGIEGGKLPNLDDLLGVENLVRNSIEEARRLARGLDVFAARDQGLTSAIRQLAVGAETLFPITCRVTGDSVEMKGQDRRSSQLYRIVQEAVNNAVRHGEATEAIIDISLRDGELQLSITDNGCGMKHPRETGGMGLRIMQHRAELAGGRLEMSSNPNGGTRVLCAIPAEGV